MRPSGRPIPASIARGIDRLLADRAMLMPAAEDAAATVEVVEVLEHRTQQRIERNSAAVRLAKDVHGSICQACGLDFAERYGEIGRDFIEVHHRRPLANLAKGGPVALRVATDLAVLCANCHRMIHQLPDSGDVDALRAILIRYGS